MACCLAPAILTAYLTTHTHSGHGFAETRTRAATVLGTIRRPCTEVRVAQAALGVVVLHVLDDSFFQPQPGTSPRDHLLSGLVPAGLLVLAGRLYPRLRAGARASLALVLGLLAVAGAVAEAVHQSLSVGPSGDEYSGLAAGAAGLVLILVGLRTLWSSRRLDERLPRRYGRRALLAACATVAGVLLVYPIAAGYVATHASKAAVPAPTLGPHREDIAFRTADGLTLRGWYVPSRNGAAVIVSPGRSAAVQRHAALLARHRYGVLVFDRRGEGESEGDPNLYGWSGTTDLEAAVRYLVRRADVDRNRIGGLGLSVGGEMLLQAAAESSALRAVVSEGAGIRSVREAARLPWDHAWLQLPFFAVATTATALSSDGAPPPGLTQLVRRIAPRPVFFVCAGRGAGGEELNPTFYAAAQAPKLLWKIPEAGHTGGLSARPEQYERRIVAFFDRALMK